MYDDNCSANEQYTTGTFLAVRRGQRGKLCKNLTFIEMFENKFYKCFSQHKLFTNLFLPS